MGNLITQGSQPKVRKQEVRRNKYLFALIGILLIGLIYAIPLIDFVPPTLNDSSIISNTSVEINISITEATLGQVKYNWAPDGVQGNGTNYTMYNDSLVLMMNFDNRSELDECTTQGASCVKDLSLYGNNGTLGNATAGTMPTWNATGKYGGAFTFDAITDYITLGDKADILSGGLTVSAWIKPTTTNGVHLIVGKGNDGSTDDNLLNYEIYQNGNEFGFKVGDGVSQYASSKSASLDTNWHWVVGVYNGTSVISYVDGVSGSFAAAPASLYDANLLLIGLREISTNAYPFNGSIDEIRIWNRSLSADEIYEQYISNLAKYNSTTWNLYVNQSKNSTTGLSDGTYTYQGCVANSTGGWNCTDLRQLIIDTFPQVYFVPPTREDGNITTDTSIEINTSIEDSSISSVISNWNGTNYTMYNDSLVLMMNFDNVSALGETASNAADLSKYGNNATCSGTCPAWTSGGKFGGGYNYDGVSNYFGIPYSSSLNLPESFTVSVWFKYNGVGPGGKVYWTILTSNNNTPLGYDETYHLWISSSDKKLGARGGNGSGEYDLYSLNAMDDSAWHQGIFTFDDDADEYRLYVDGVLNGNQTVDASWNPSTLSSGITLGWWNAYLDYFNGLIDEVRIWNRSLSDAEAYQQYISNLKKFNSSYWELYVNQSKNSTTRLDFGNYTYQSCATDMVGLSNCTGIRTITIYGLLAINITSLFNNQEIARGSGSYTGEDSLGVVPDSVNITGKIYYNTTLGGISGATCYFYENSVLLGNSETNSSGECYYSYDKASENIGIKQFLANYTFGVYSKAISESQANISLTRYVTSLSVGNLRDNGKYYDGDTAVLNINIKKSNSSVTNEQYDPQNISVEIMNSADELRGYLSYPENVTQISSGVYQANLTVDYGAGSSEFVKWEVKLSDDGYTNYIGSSVEADKAICSADFGAWGDWTTCSSSTQTRTRTDATGCTETESQSCDSGGGGGGGGGDTCVSDCTSGDVQGSCENSNSLKERTCGNYDADSCYEWSEWDSIHCSSGEVCSLGKCIEEEGKIPNETIIGEGKCSGNWKCWEWEKCEATYSIFDAIKEISLEGIQKRECNNTNCNSKKIERRTCDFRIPIRVSPKEICGEKYLLVYSLETGELLSKISLGENYLNFRKLDLQFAPDENVDCEDKILKLYNFIDWAFWIALISWILFFWLLFLFFRRRKEDENRQEIVISSRAPKEKIIPEHESKLSKLTYKEWLGGMFNFSHIKEKIARKRYLPRHSLKKLINKKVYTHEGRFVGRVVEAHLENNRIAKLKVKLNKSGKTRGVIFSYAHVHDVGEIVIVNDKLFENIK